MRNQIILAAIAGYEARAIQLRHPHSSGDIAGCECVGHTDREINADGYIEYVHTDGETYLFPANYGTHQCNAWDAWQAPWCDDPAVQPAFCNAQWCYVELETCNAPDIR